MGNKARKDMDESKFDVLFKIVFAGDLGVGKSSIILQLVENTFTGEEIATIGSEFRIKMLELNKKKVKLQFWDTDGQEKFRAITVSYYRGSSAVVIVFDLTKKKTLENVERWITDSKSMTNKPNTIFLIIGNKSDLKSQKVVSEKDVHAIIERCSDAQTVIYYSEASAKTGDGLTSAFMNLSEALMKEDRF